MILGKESILADNGAIIPRITGYDDNLALYLKHKWQEAFDQLSDTLYDASIILYLFTSDGYHIGMTCDNAHNSLRDMPLRSSTGSNFLDLVKNYGQLLYIEDARDDSRLEDSIELSLSYKNIVGIPIFSRDNQMIGILEVLRRTTFTMEDDITLLSWLATSVEESIKHYELEMIIESMSSHDHLTQLITRDKMMMLLGEEFERSQRSEMPFSLVVIDIDNFKHINDMYGFATGDAVLQDFARLLMSRVRKVDYACRWDGDAFAVLLPQTEMLGANQLVAELFDTLTAHAFDKVGQCYFSIGIADFAITDESINDVLLRLDKALYRVKAFGGNNHVARYH
jgi:diguanylate cyclase (GGDEF)-like protein